MLFVFVRARGSSRCWCPVDGVASLQCICTRRRRVWPAVIKMCSVSSWIDPGGLQHNSCIQIHFLLLESQLPPLLLTSTSAPPFTAVFLLSLPLKALCQCSTLNWVPNWRLYSPLIPYSSSVDTVYAQRSSAEWSGLSSNRCHVWTIERKDPAKIAVKYFINVTGLGMNAYLTLFTACLQLHDCYLSFYSRSLNCNFLCRCSFSLRRGHQIISPIPFTDVWAAG